MTNSDEPVVTVCGLILEKEFRYNPAFESVSIYSINIGPINIVISQHDPGIDLYVSSVRVYNRTIRRTDTLQTCIDWAQKRLPEMVQEADAAMDEVRRWIR